jgi:undecaprenyl phosphate N,N'-diacetylbacillosamine 1-phosphate transferase
MTSKHVDDFSKRTLDLLLSISLLIVTAPILALIGLAIRFSSPGPALFVQDRVGKDGKLFRAYKFRTMIEGAVGRGAGFVIDGEDDPRITKVGKFLRRWSLDELPQLINILKGEMSVVGPRPTLLYQVEQYDEFQRRRLEVKPGITGWAQIHGRRVLSWPRRIEYDVWYVDNWSFRLDVEIIINTIPVLFKKEGLYIERDKSVITPQDETPR